MAMAKANTKACINLPEWKNLPEDCWELIFNRLPADNYFASLSLVCKQFLSITNRLRIKFSAADHAILIGGKFSKLVNRFSHLKSIDFSYLVRYIDVALLGNAISFLLNVEEIDISNKFKIPIRSLKKLGSNSRNLRVLKCKNLDVLRDSDLVAIANSLPLLEELDISKAVNCKHRILDDFGSRKKMAVTDAGIKVLAMNLKRMRRINVSGHDFITAESLVCLSMNCRYLEGIEALDCNFLKSYWILSVMRNNAKLRSISVCFVDFRDTSSSLVFDDDDSVSYWQCLESLEISYSNQWDEFLYLLARANNLPALRRLSLVASLGSEITSSALSSLLCRCQSLEYLALGLEGFLTDEFVRDLSPYLHNLVAVKLEKCYKLTISTFYILAKSCPLLRDFEMPGANLKETRSITMDDCVNKNMNIKSLNLECNSKLNDECLKRFAFICPNLEKVDVSCTNITEKGIADVLDMCPQLRSLNCDDCFRIKTFREGPKLPNLKELYVSSPAIGDRELATIGKRCPGLLKLRLICCDKVTTRGVEEVLRLCKSLTEINLTGCQRVHLNRLDWTVLSRPSSLEKFMVSSSFTEATRERLFLSYGFRVCMG